MTGIDHLLFVLALIIITRGGWKLAKTVTAFTVSHSVTLTAATLGFVHVWQKPVEAIIALSIIFVAAEILHARQGRLGITARAPWIVALTFGFCMVWVSQAVSATPAFLRPTSPSHFFF